MKYIYIILLVLFSINLIAQNRTYEFENVTIPVAADSGFEWELQETYSDDFNYGVGEGKSSPLFTSKWTDTYSPDPNFSGPGATLWTTSNTEINGTTGRLEIRATPGEVDSSTGTVTTVNCGVVSSRIKATYPIFIEANIKAANVENSSNFWMLDDGGFNEVDVLEVYGGSADDFFSKQMSTNFHVFDREGPNGPINVDNTYQTFFQTDRTLPNRQPNNTDFWRNGFHTFGVYWKSPNEITFYIDGLPTINGNHFVQGRLANGLDGSFEDAILQSPIPNDGNMPIDKNLPENQIFRNLFMILDLESHFGRPISSEADLNDGVKNLMEVEWVRAYKQVPEGTAGNDRTRTISFNNKSEFIPSGQTLPEVEFGQELSIEISYATDRISGVENDLDYVAIQLREVDENGGIVGTSAFQVAAIETSPNVDTITFDLTVPRNFATGPDNVTPFTDEIPTTDDLDSGHKLLLIIFSQSHNVEGSTNLVFANANGEIIINEDSTLSVPSFKDSKAVISVFPNPTHDLLKISGKFESWKIYNLLGNLVEKGNSTEVNTSNLVSGLYYIALDADKTKTYKFIKD